MIVQSPYTQWTDCACNCRVKVAGVVYAEGWECDRWPVHEIKKAGDIGAVVETQAPDAWASGELTKRKRKVMKGEEAWKGWCRVRPVVQHCVTSIFPPRACHGARSLDG